MPPGMFGDAEPAGVNVMTVQGKSTLTGSFAGDSTASLLNSAEADARILVRQADQTLSAPMARLREDTVCFCADHFHGRAQALYSSVSFGVGGALGAWISGLLWEPMGGTLVFALAGAASLAGAVVAWLTLSPVKR